MRRTSSNGRSERNKALVRRFVAEIFVAGRPEAVDELVAEDFVPHSWPSTGDPRGDLKRSIERVGAGLADVAFTIEDLIGEADRVAARLTTSATHAGEFMGMPASHRRYTSRGDPHLPDPRQARSSSAGTSSTG